MDLRAAEERKALEAGRDSWSTFTSVRCTVLLAAADGRSPQQISADLGRSEAFVRRVLKTYREQGQASLAPHSARVTTRLLRAIGDVTITMDDCRTCEGFPLLTATGHISAAACLEGRSLLEAYGVDESGLPRDRELTADDLVNLPDAHKFKNVLLVRSPLTCDAPTGVCARCHGRTASGTTPEIGHSVGVEAAVGIGVSMAAGRLVPRQAPHPGGDAPPTFHIGSTQGPAPATRRSEYSGTARLVKIDPIRRRDGKLVASRSGTAFVEPPGFDRVISKARGLEKLVLLNAIHAVRDYPVSSGWVLGVEDGDDVSEGQLLASIEWEPGTTRRRANKPPIVTVSKVDGFVRFRDIVAGDNLYDEPFEGCPGRLLIKSRPEQTPRVEILDEQGASSAVIQVPNRARIVVEDGQPIRTGDRVYEIGMGLRIARGSLARILELLEARSPDEAATLAETDGVVEFGPIRGSEKVVIVDDGEDKREYRIPVGIILWSEHGREVQAGDQLSNGDPDPIDLMQILGEEEAARHLLDRLLLEVWSRRDRPPKAQHVELVLREMLRWIKVVDPGDTAFRCGEILDRFRFVEENERVLEDDGAFARGWPTVVGVSGVGRLKARAS